MLDRTQLISQQHAVVMQMSTQNSKLSGVLGVDDTQQGSVRSTDLTGDLPKLLSSASVYMRKTITSCQAIWGQQGVLAPR